MTESTIAFVTAQLKLDEGFKGRPYLDSRSIVTIGYGRNLDDHGISEPEAAVMLGNDIASALSALRLKIGAFDSFSEARQAALLNMCFNMGIAKLMTFQKMIAALENNDPYTAGKEMKESTWYSQVHAKRADPLIAQMQTGLFPKEA